MVEIVATHFSLVNVNFNCFTCKEKHSEARRRDMKGCIGKLPSPVAKYKDKIIFYKCPSNFYSPYIAELANHARHLENGLLPYTGGLLEQPAKLVELLTLLNSLRVEDEIERIKKQTLEAKKNGRQSNKN